MSAEIAVYIVHRGEKAGPFSLRDLKRQVAAGNISRETLVWYKGLEEWLPLNVAFSEEIEIADIPRSQGSRTGLSLIRDDVPPEIPEAIHVPWAGPGKGGGKLFIPGATEEETLSTPEWEKREAKRLAKKSPVGGIIVRLLVIAALIFLLYLLFAPAN